MDADRPDSIINNFKTNADCHLPSNYETIGNQYTNTNIQCDNNIKSITTDDKTNATTPTPTTATTARTIETTPSNGHVNTKHNIVVQVPINCDHGHTVENHTDSMLSNVLNISDTANAPNTTNTNGCHYREYYVDTSDRSDRNNAVGIGSELNVNGVSETATISTVATASDNRVSSVRDLDAKTIVNNQLINNAQLDNQLNSDEPTVDVLTSATAPITSFVAPPNYQSPDDQTHDQAATNCVSNGKEESGGQIHQPDQADQADTAQQPSTMYQRIRSSSDEDDADDKVRTNGYMRVPSLLRKKKRVSNSVPATNYGSVARHSGHYSNNGNGTGDNVSQSKRGLYNEFVNLLCDTDISGAAANEANRKRNSNGLSQNDGRAMENKPLLLDLGSTTTTTTTTATATSSAQQPRKPKSIVKSPSTQTFGSNEKYFDNNRKPRLSIQCTGTDPERPVLHVQFLPHKPTAHTNGMSQSLPQQTQFVRDNGTVPASYDDGPNQCGYNGGSLRSSISTGSDDESSSSSSSSSSDSSSSDEETIGFAEAKAPDGGWGWVVVFASFMVNLIADGVTFSFGVIYVEFLNYFGEGKAKTAWIGSLFMAMPLLSGPIASFLTDRYGCRRVTIAGSILASLGFFISAFVDSMEMLFFTFGILAGFGLSLCYVAAVVIVAYYFDKRRSFATGLSVCGSGIGTFIFAPLTQVLIDEYGWRGCTLILSGLFLNMCVCGLLMRDLEWTTYRAKLKAKQRKKRHRLGISAESFSVSNSTNTAGTASNAQNNHETLNTGDYYKNDENGDAVLMDGNDQPKSDPRLFSSLITLPTFVKNGEKVPMEVLELLSSNKNIHNVLLQNYPGLAHSRSFSQPLAISRHSNSDGIPLEHNLSPETNLSPEANLGATNPERMRSKSTKSRSIRDEQAFLNWLKEDNPRNTRRPKGVQLMLSHRNQPTSAYLKDLRMHRHSLTYRGAMLNINRYRLRASSCPDIYRNSMTTIAKEKTQFRQGVEEFKAVLLDMLDFSYFMDPRFLLFSISNFFLYTWYDVPYVYLADYAIEMEFTESDASYLISLIGIVNMVGEIILGWCGDRKSISAGMIYAVCMLFCGLVTGLVPLLKTYTGLSVVSGLFGLFIAANYALTSIILVELITLDRFTNAYGLLLLVQGVANLMGPPLAGWITDYTGSYDLAFYLAGVFIAVSGVLMVILPAHGKYKKYCELRRKSSEQKSSYSEQQSSSQTDVENNAAPSTATPSHNTILASKPTLKMNGNASNCYGIITNDVMGKNHGQPINHV